MNNYLLELKNKTALVTGASSGIGRQIAIDLAEMGTKVMAIARREEKLRELKSHHPEHIEFMSGDINDQDFIKSLDRSRAFDIDILINNAGLALGKDEFYQSSDSDNDIVINTNISSAFKIAKRSLNYWKLNNRAGDLINLTSIASHESYSGGVVYAATKHALLSMSKSLRQETYGQDIRIMSISPGMVETEFSETRFRGDKEKARSVYQGFTPLNAQDISYQVIHALRCPRHVNLDEILILATDQAGATKVNKKS